MTEHTNRISVEQCCSYYSIEVTFVQSLSEHGLIELIQQDTHYFIGFEQLASLEKYMHMHYDLDINMEGLEAIAHLLNKVQVLQTEVRTLRNALGT
ncbi:chaperone modulator CbpM [Niabella drilacis]|uniref:MerR HTH family regulatory protein n=1 Tax=Niabella drilacis (strain DSM 25811 / CCM 8410 / CCUG 62505 / LMG 26954 / E90) TaxID=1285928 RepID=A0A1G6IQ09_NIADE|nr:chaperone modulator CbpM [Niabella drilacis]SDC08105.1 MerR HTH family regulatory protein [Niabella drilacis]